MLRVVTKHCQLTPIGQAKGRSGYSLVEVLVAVGILGLLMGLVLAGVQRVRLAARSIEDKNNIRQISIAMHSYASAHDGSKLPGRLGPAMVVRPNLMDTSPLVLILPYLDPNLVSPGALRFPPIRYYLSPLDPTLAGTTLPSTHNLSSYAVNQQAFLGRPDLVSTIRDGLSNTVMLTTRYAYCRYTEGRVKNGVMTTYRYTEPLYPSDPTQLIGERSGTVADPAWRDVVPRTIENRTVSSVPGLTFQSAPHRAQADSRMAQSWLPSGLTLCFFDGSIRTATPAIEESVFWSLFTPLGGEVANLE